MAHTQMNINEPS